MFSPIKLSDNYYVAPQILTDDIPSIKEMGFDLVINNRPEGESDEQPNGNSLRDAVESTGLRYVENPIVLSSLSLSEVGVQAEACSGKSKVLAFCRTGTRSSVLWVLNNEGADKSFEELVGDVQASGIDLARCMGVMEGLKG
ncbi:TIGR01244 family sulfur transferase [Marinomonas sp. 2405UD68-3]|uniref:TIGR01244 family sulfur transferase n=1 Tax=Marinomonas sp. 2405UD68-3 TaxID=3391835 RepID=UPI0039C94EA9